MRHLILLLPIAIVACATTGPGDGSISIETTSQGKSLPAVHCMVSTNTGNWNITTPASVSVGHVSGDLRVVCNKDGYRTAELIFKPSNGLGSNVGLGVGGGSGNVGVGVGLNFPIGLGRNTYPSRVTVDMNPL